MTTDEELDDIIRTEYYYSRMMARLIDDIESGRDAELTERLESEEADRHWKDRED